ncbi:MAG TPA: PepSY domain-containing protein [Candidatus Baltobacteraceae bacterium]|jgi:uncharacterized membrane protein YkoI|nr:PepSY domain-containing protein [Candidatus Baltobacteraceae bacterium]
MKTTVLAAIFAAGALTVASAATAMPLTGAQLSAHARVTLKQARAKALGREHGRIVAQELEREGGGSGLRYSFDVKVGNVVHEVGIDAVTGAVVEDSIDSGND